MHLYIIIRDIVFRGYMYNFSFLRTAAVIILSIFFCTGVLAESDPVVAIVNGVKIYRSDVDYAYKTFPDQYGESSFESVYQTIVEQLVDRVVIDQAAAKSGLENDPDVIKRIKFIKASIIENLYVERIAKGKITEAEIKAKYDELSKEYVSEDEIKASHILVATEDEAYDIKDELDDGGDFATLANKYSLDSKDGSGGDLGYFTRERMIPEFADVAFAAKIGKVTDPVKTQFGWHLILVTDKRKSTLPPFDQTKQQISEMLAREFAIKAIDELKARAKIELFSASGAPIENSDTDNK